LLKPAAHLPPSGLVLVGVKLPHTPIIILLVPALLLLKLHDPRVLLYSLIVQVLLDSLVIGNLAFSG
jgi:hypothetical protein